MNENTHNCFKFENGKRKIQVMGYISGQGYKQKRTINQKSNGFILTRFLIDSLTLLF